jgi:hypothetical protein
MASCKMEHEFMYYEKIYKSGVFHIIIMKEKIFATFYMERIRFAL